MKRIEALLAKRQKPVDKRKRDEIVKAAFKTINPVIKAIFDDLPQVNVIAVQGYTPHFNDGEPCEWEIGASVDWFCRSEVYYTPIQYDEYDDKEDKSEYAALFSKRDPGYRTRDKEPDYPNLFKARDLILTLSDEFEIVDSDNGTWWLFVRDNTAKNGFTVKSDTFEHD